jgi:hypothetical protein
MTEPATGTLDANPVSEPAPGPAPVQPIRNASDAQVTDAKRQAFERAAATVGKPDKGATAEPAKADGPPTFFKKAEEPPAFDPGKLPPELQPIYKSMQADATRKWEEAARMRRETEERQAKLDEERKLMLEGQRALLESFQKNRSPEAGAQTPTTLEQIQQLRDEGRHAEADQLVLQYVEQIAEKKAEPFVREAQVNLVKTTFNDTLAQTRMQNPVANHYWDQVAQVFDGNAPEMVAIRKAVLTSPENIRQFVPMVIDYIASRQHAATLEQNYEAAVKAGIEKGLAERRAAAGRTPGRLVESGSVSRDSGPGKIDLKESFRLAKETV